jgi:hypothetical protein
VFKEVRVEVLSAYNKRFENPFSADVSISSMVKKFLSSPKFQDCLWRQSGLLFNGYWGLFPRG